MKKNIIFTKSFVSLQILLKFFCITFFLIKLVCPNNKICWQTYLGFNLFFQDFLIHILKLKNLLQIVTATHKHCCFRRPVLLYQRTVPDSLRSRRLRADGWRRGARAIQQKQVKVKRDIGNKDGRRTRRKDETSMLILIYEDETLTCWTTRPRRWERATLQGRASGTGSSRMIHQRAWSTRMRHRRP